MKTFSVEGTSPESLAAAMASAMARIGVQAAQAAKVEVSVAAAHKDADGIFRVTVNVRSLDKGEDPDLQDDDDGDDESGRAGRDSERLRRRSERISQEIREHMLHQFHVGTHVPTMDEAEQQVREAVENATLDTSDYMQSMADQTDRAERADRDETPLVAAPVFDTVDAQPETAVGGASEAGGSRITMLSREVDEVIGLLSLGFYDPPRPEASSPIAPDGTQPERARERAPRDGDAPLPTQPPVPVQPAPGT